MKKYKVLHSLFLIICIVSSATCQPVSVDVESRVESILAQMSLEEKIDYIGGHNQFHIRSIKRLGVPEIKMSDGPVGVRNYGLATAFPAGISLAASWNKDLAFEEGKALGAEARARGVHILLGPGVNIYRAPMCGRNFEYFGEDPFLASQISVPYINGVQSQHVVATIKHYVANNQEYDRHNVSSNVDDRTLREIYLPSFRAAVREASVGAVMTAYNLVNNIHCSQHGYLINEVLKREWGFTGIVLSDWGSTYDGVAAANAGLDLEMPSGARMNRETLMSAIEQGRVSEETINDKVRRILRTIIRMGFLDRGQKDSSAKQDGFRAIALQVAREGSVLLKNKHQILPLNLDDVKSILITGPNAHPAVTGGGGSSFTNPFRSTSLLDGIKTIANNEMIVTYYAAIENRIADAVFESAKYFTGKDYNVGLQAEYFDNMMFEGEPSIKRVDDRVNFRWEGPPADGLKAIHFAVRWKGEIKIDQPGKYDFIVKGDDGYRLYLDDQLLIDRWRDQPPTTQLVTVEFGEPKVLSLRLEYYQNAGGAELRFGWRPHLSFDAKKTTEIAVKSDVAVICVGFNKELESEGFDRPFNLPAGQLELIRTVAKANPNTIVILNAGGNVAMDDWINDVSALIHAWYPGQEGGQALAEILFGKVNPSGKLPATFELDWSQNPTHETYYDTNQDKQVEYSEGIFVGYRHFDANNISPRFPFGYGLSYTTFEYSNLKLSSNRIAAGDKIAITFDITNRGQRAGAEIAQVYVHDEISALPRPIKELKGFEKVFLEAGQTKTVCIELECNDLAYYDPSEKNWVVEPGAFEVMVGSSSRDILLSEKFDYVAR